MCPWSFGVALVMTSLWRVFVCDIIWCGFGLTTFGVVLVLTTFAVVLVVTTFGVVLVVTSFGMVLVWCVC